MGEKLADLLCRIVIIRLTERRPDGYSPPHSLLPSFPHPSGVLRLHSPLSGFLPLSVSPLSSLALSEGDLPFPSLQEVGSEGAERGRREPDADVGRKKDGRGADARPSSLDIFWDWSGTVDVKVFQVGHNILPLLALAGYY